MRTEPPNSTHEHHGSILLTTSCTMQHAEPALCLHVVIITFKAKKIFPAYSAAPCFATRASTRTRHVCYLISMTTPLKPIESMSSSTIRYKQLHTEQACLHLSKENKLCGGSTHKAQPDQIQHPHWCQAFRVKKDSHTKCMCTLCRATSSLLRQIPSTVIKLSIHDLRPL
jgi:hypothetical protein